MTAPGRVSASRRRCRFAPRGGESSRSLFEFRGDATTSFGAPSNRGKTFKYPSCRRNTAMSIWPSRSSYGRLLEGEEALQPR